MKNRQFDGQNPRSAIQSKRLIQKWIAVLKRSSAREGVFAFKSVCAIADSNRSGSRALPILDAPEIQTKQEMEP